MTLYHWLSPLLLVGIIACGGGSTTPNSSASNANSKWLVDTNFVRDGALQFTNKNSYTLSLSYLIE